MSTAIRPTNGQALQNLERMPPQDLDVEKAVLSAMLLSPRFLSDVSDWLQPGDFYYTQHGILFTSICELHRFDGRLDSWTLADYLKGTGRLEQVGGLDYITRLASFSTTGANIKLHAQIVKKHALSRSLLALSSTLATTIYEQNKEAPEVAQWALQELLTLTQGQEQRKGYTMREVMDEVQAQLEKSMAQKKKWAGLDTGFPGLNNFLNGLVEHEMTICGASPKIGKTRLALQIARCVSVSGQGRVLIYSVEMKRIQLGQYWGCAVAELDLARFRRGLLNEQEYKAYQQARAEIDQWPIIIDDEAPLTIPQLYASAERQFAKHADIKLVIVDYLQLMEGPEREDTPKYDKILRQLKDFKKRYPVHLWVLSQLSREVNTRKDRRPQVSDLRGTGMIEANADNIALIYRPGMYEHLLPTEGHRVELICPYLRFSPPGSVPLQWNPDKARFDNPDALLFHKPTPQVEHHDNR